MDTQVGLRLLSRHPALRDTRASCPLRSDAQRPLGYGAFAPNPTYVNNFATLMRMRSQQYGAMCVRLVRAGLGFERLRFVRDLQTQTLHHLIEHMIA